MKTWSGLFLGLLLASLGVYAQQPVTTGIPTGAIQFFDRTTATGCPSTWAEVTAARGYYLTGLVSGGTKGTAVGTALTDQENRTHTHAMNHTHDITHTHTWSFTTGAASASMSKRALAVTNVSTGAHTHDGSGTTPGPSTSNSGTESAATGTQTTVVPYLQYLVCKKS